MLHAPGRACACSPTADRAGLPRRPYGQTKAQEETTHQDTPDIPTPHHAVTVKEETVMSRIQDIPAAERRALEDLYDRCGGRSWKKSDGWKTGASEWHGVTVENRHVVKISLYSNGLIGGAFDVDVGSGEEGGVYALGLERWGTSDPSARIEFQNSRAVGFWLR